MDDLFFIQLSSLDKRYNTLSVSKEKASRFSKDIFEPNQVILHANNDLRDWQTQYKKHKEALENYVKQNNITNIRNLSTHYIEETKCWVHVLQEKKELRYIQSHQNGGIIHCKELDVPKWYKQKGVEKYAPAPALKRKKSQIKQFANAVISIGVGMAKGVKSAFAHIGRLFVKAVDSLFFDRMKPGETIDFKHLYDNKDSASTESLSVKGTIDSSQQARNPDNEGSRTSTLGPKI
jgi:hypothetical protein